MKLTKNRFSMLSCKKVMLLCLLIKVALFISLLAKYSATHPSLQQLYRYVNNSTVNTFFPKTRQNKNILIWNSPERIETAVFGFGHEPFIKHGCEISECEIFSTASSLPLEQYDAIIIHMHELWTTKLPTFQRRKHQRFVFLTQESPVAMPIDVTTIGNFFNWTMSYRLNSDVKLLYGRIEPGPTAPTTSEETQKLIDATHFPSAKNYAAKKTRPVAWMASSCETSSLRETYVSQLSKFIPIDIYGLCGNLTCRRYAEGISDRQCYDKMETKYKFYLSFEDSICADYITYEFFQIMGHDMVPVVYGGGNYKQIAPPHSFINAMEFTPEKLATYLKLLDADDSLYNEYFWWKDHYRVEVGVEQMARHGFCDLCKKLHLDEGVIKYYPELVSEWHSRTKCNRFVSWDTVS